MSAIFLLLGGCGGPATEDAADATGQSGHQMRVVSDPAMQPMAAEPAIALATRADVLPTALTLDEVQQRIFVPDLGWLPLAEFWDIYENNPARLPPDFDYKAMHQLKVSMAGKNHDDA